MGRDSQPSSVAPTIYNVVLTTAGVEVSQTLQDDDTLPGIKKIQLKSRTANALSYSYVSGGNFTTLASGETYWQDGLDARHITIFLKGTVNGQVAELEVWL